MEIPFSDVYHFPACKTILVHSHCITFDYIARRIGDKQKAIASERLLLCLLSKWISLIVLIWFHCFPIAYNQGQIATKNIAKYSNGILMHYQIAEATSNHKNRINLGINANELLSRNFRQVIWNRFSSSHKPHLIELNAFHNIHRTHCQQHACDRAIFVKYSYPVESYPCII